MTAVGCGTVEVNPPQHSIKRREKCGLNDRFRYPQIRSPQKPQKMLRNGAKVRCWASQRSAYETIVTGLATALRLAGAVAFAQSSSLLLVLSMV
ncbi:MAG TPA: hypothetical protein VK567_16880 [Bradyrhizobium sp.]|jgi:hypothetical protein|nr:hypothetical protein [Bradyrhizobium sp.]